MPFFQCADTVDVLFFGSSHMFDGVYPMNLWADYGITSYNCAMSASTIPSSYWALELTLDYAHPKLIVFDCYNFTYGTMHSGYSFMAEFFDAFPLSAKKVEAILDLQQDNLNQKEAMSLLWPFYNYHNRWEELSALDFVPEYSLEKGAWLGANVALPNPVSLTSEKMALDPDSPGMEYFVKLIELCRERDICLILTYLPFPADENQIMESNAIYDLADEYGVDYINFLSEDVVDFDTDMFDSYSHLNSSGAEKITSFLGSYITENYGIMDRRSDPACSVWHEDLAKYQEYRFSLVENQYHLFTTLMLLRYSGISSIVAVENASDLFADPLYVKLMKNAAWGSELPGLTRATASGEKYVLLIDNVNKTVQEFCGSQIPETLETGFGVLDFDRGQLRLNGMAVHCPGDETVSDVQCYIFDNNSPEQKNCPRSFTKTIACEYLRNY